MGVLGLEQGHDGLLEVDGPLGLLLGGLDGLNSEALELDQDGLLEHAHALLGHGLVVLQGQVPPVVALLVAGQRGQLLVGVSVLGVADLEDHPAEGLHLHDDLALDANAGVLVLVQLGDAGKEAAAVVVDHLVTGLVEEAGVDAVAATQLRLRGAGVRVAGGAVDAGAILGAVAGGGRPDVEAGRGGGEA